METGHPRLAIGAFALLVGVLAALCALAFSGGGTNAATAAGDTTQSSESFGVLRSLPDASATGAFAQSDRVAPGIATAPVHTVNALNGDRFAVAATTDTVCVQTTHADGNYATGACGRIADAQANGFFQFSRPAPGTAKAGEVRLAALVPDGVQNVSVTLTTGKSVDIPVAQNIAAADLDAAPATARFTRAGEPTVTKFHGG
ncbi:hypothetical protein GKE82_25045 [Conexibacter sp. W3-3-2]|uniref:hypothetical protein n=1 Tax=Conexibacter sp. W3-3-2 TaxID=2675227 RepID=UPI0012BA1C15|nr:hypothetical protein [Conexibacter sp. W3-3-2]MTD47473.1 hypothetical protein [Conexibacter sp. W3-3-2]